jgi:hypothetical protein
LSGHQRGKASTLLIAADEDMDDHDEVKALHALLKERDQCLSALRPSSKASRTSQRTAATRSRRLRRKNATSAKRLASGSKDTNVGTSKKKKQKPSFKLSKRGVGARVPRRLWGRKTPSLLVLLLIKDQPPCLLAVTSTLRRLRVYL